MKILDSREVCIRWTPSDSEIVNGNQNMYRRTFDRFGIEDIKYTIFSGVLVHCLISRKYISYEIRCVIRF